MRKLLGIIFGFLIAENIVSSEFRGLSIKDITYIKINKRETILPDEYGIYKLAFPDTNIYRKIDFHIHPFVDNSGNNFTVSELFFDSNLDKIADLIVVYHLKDFNDIMRWYRIDSTKAPPFIIKHDDRKWTGYSYSNKSKKYEIIKKEAIKGDEIITKKI
ncbi:MAG: hypothetical protein QXD05_00415 [Candidatus Pacearchaeota archaeon]